MNDDEDVEFQAIVIDNGTAMCKAGGKDVYRNSGYYIPVVDTSDFLSVAGEDMPSAIFPSVISRPRLQAVKTGMGQRDSYIGYEAQAKRDILSLRYPVKCGVVTNWCDMERLWHHTIYNELQLLPEELPILLTEPSLNPNRNRERTIEIMFESFNPPAFYLANQAVLSLYGSGRTTGIVLDSGEDITHVVPIYEGSPIVHAINQVCMGGRHLTEYLAEALKDRADLSSLMYANAVIQDVKEKLCYVALDPTWEKQSMETNSIKKVYELPDGNVITMDAERSVYQSILIIFVFLLLELGAETWLVHSFLIPDALFRPSLMALDTPGIQDLVHSSIRKCDVDLRRDFLDNVILSGGTTMFPGIRERLEKELHVLFPTSMRVLIRAYPERKHQAWIGGSILASLSTFQHLYVSKQQYDETGSIIVHRSCL
ncbi:actin [Serendipita sp. 399]|nr:actin [Serendipita sp. 399]